RRKPRRATLSPSIRVAILDRRSWRASAPAGTSIACWWVSAPTPPRRPPPEPSSPQMAPKSARSPPLHSRRRLEKLSRSVMCARSMPRRAPNSRPMAPPRLRRLWLPAKLFQHRQRDVEMPRAAAQLHSRLHVAVEIRSTGYAQIEFAREGEILLHVLWPVIAVINLKRSKTGGAHFGHQSPHLLRIVIPQPHRMRDGR